MLCVEYHLLLVLIFLLKSGISLDLEIGKNGSINKFFNWV